MSHATPPASPSLARPVLGSPASWFGADSYPAAAMRRSAEGRAVARLAIGADGRVTGCTIVASSGDADLDRATCAVPMRAGRFSPALDAGGRPIAAGYTLPVRWVLPRDAPASAPEPPPAPRNRRDWFERLTLAHHLIGMATALFALGAARARRWLGRARFREGQGWAEGDRLPARRRRRLRLPSGRLGRFATAAVSAILLAALMAWLGW